MFHIDTIADRGWARCTRLRGEDLQLVVTNEVGPRIIECSVAGGPNLFKEFPAELGRTSGEEYLLFGGHRLWHAPEAYPRSYARDFGPVTVEPLADGARFVQPDELETRVRKSITVRFLGDRRLSIEHRLRNGNPWEIELAAWAMSLFPEDSRVIVPQEPWRPHPEYLDPARTLTLWGYTRMDDPRVTWGRRWLQLREDATVEGKFKLGIDNRQRWLAAWTRGWLVLRSFGRDPSARYPDGGCNCEIFTMPGFLEVETLGPLTRLAPGAELCHEEIWHFHEQPELPTEDAALGPLLEPLAAELAFPERGR